MKKIPKSFEAFIALWEVSQPMVLFDEDDNALLGQCNVDDTTIEIARCGADGKKLKMRDRLETLGHEIAHVIDLTLHHDEKDQWSHSEVDMVGRLITQIFYSMEF